VLPGGLLANLLGMISTSIGERALSQTLANQDLELGQAMAEMANANAMQSMQDALAADVAAANAIAAANAAAPTTGVLGGGTRSFGANVAAANDAADLGGLLGLSSAEVGQAEADAVAAAEAAAAEAAANAVADAVGMSGFGDMGGYGGTGAASSDASGGYGGVDSGGYGGDGSGGYYYKGGKVTMNGLLTDVDPPGPDEGYGALQAGEYVIKKSTAKKLGDKKLNALNQGRATIKMSK
jgi:hypothetical protein